MSFWFRNGLAGLAACVLWSSPGVSEPLPPPEGEVILTVQGQISQRNQGDVAVFDQAMIEALGVEVMHTGTIWTEGVNEFHGVPLYRLLERVGASGGTLRLTALNEYAIEIPLSDAVEGGPVLAFQMDGKRLSPRDKGPFWMVYPFDQNPDYKNEVTYSRAIWQLSLIEVLP